MKAFFLSLFRSRTPHGPFIDQVDIVAGISAGLLGPWLMFCIPFDILLAPSAWVADMLDVIRLNQENSEFMLGFPIWTLMGGWLLVLLGLGFLLVLRYVGWAGPVTVLAFLLALAILINLRLPSGPSNLASLGLFIPTLVAVHIIPMWMALRATGRIGAPSTVPLE